MRAPLLIAATLTALASACEWGWEEINDKCYKLQRGRMGWTYHNLDCVYAGGTLASVSNYEENDAVRRVANGQTVYIGGATFGWGWEWSDGSYWGGFSNWANQDDSRPPPGKPCMKMNRDGYWEASCCAHPAAPAVCVRKF